MTVSFDVQPKEHTGSPLFFVKVSEDGKVVRQFELCLAEGGTLEEAQQQAPAIYEEQVAALPQPSY